MAQLWRCLLTALNRCVWVRVGGQLGCESGSGSVSWGSEWWRSGAVTVFAIFMAAYFARWLNHCMYVHEWMPHAFRHGMSPCGRYVRANQVERICIVAGV